MTEVIVVGIISGVFGALAAVIPVWINQRHTPSRRVSDTAVIVDATGKVITTLREEIDRLDHELEDARGEIKGLKQLVRNLQDQVRDLGGTPVTNGRV